MSAMFVFRVTNWRVHHQFYKVVCRSLKFMLLNSEYRILLLIAFQLEIYYKNDWIMMERMILLFFICFTYHLVISYTLSSFCASKCVCVVFTELYECKKFVKNYTLFIKNYQHLAIFLLHYKHSLLKLINFMLLYVTH